VNEWAILKPVALLLSGQPVPILLLRRQVRQNGTDGHVQQLTWLIASLGLCGVGGKVRQIFDLGGFLDLFTIVAKTASRPFC